MSYRLGFRKPLTLCVLAVTTGFLTTRSSTNSKGSLPPAFYTTAATSIKPETVMNAGLMDMFNNAVGSKNSGGKWSSETFLREVQAG
jgi:hypothetical protein